MIKQREANSWKSVSYAKSITGAQTYTKFPIVLRTTEQSIPTWSVKGNTETSGTPSPSNPVEVNGVGERTANLWNGEYETGAYSESTGEKTPNANTYRSADYIAVQPNTQYTFSTNGSGFSFSRYFYYDSNKNFISTNTNMGTITTPNNCYYINFHSATLKNTYPDGLTDNMLTAGSTVPSSYIPYGYKIPISSNGAALTPVYLTEQLMKIGDTADSLVSTGTVTRALKKFVFDGTENDWQVASTTVGVRFNIPVPDINESIASSPKSICSHFFLGTSSTDYGAYSISYAGGSVTKFICKPESTITTVTQLKQWLADQYAAGTPLTLWGVADTPTTETFTATPIPTTSGLNTINVNTTVKPSEMSLTYDGYKICKHKRKSANLFDGVLLDGYTDENYEQAGNLDVYKTIKISLQAGTYTVSFENPVNIVRYIHDNLYEYNQGTNVTEFTFTTTTNNYVYLGFRLSVSSTTPWDNSNIMFNTGQTALPYAPYWK